MALNSKESYRDNPLLKKCGVDYSYTQEEVDEVVMNYLESLKNDQTIF
jgi:hypothetical protein